jgi:hypothetical protein
MEHFAFSYGLWISFRRSQAMKNEATKHSIVYWSAPVHVRVGNGPSESIFGPEVAVDYLRHRWPARSSPQYLAALQACSAALDWRESPDFAREVFVAASIEAGMLA